MNEELKKRFTCSDCNKHRVKCRCPALKLCDEFLKSMNQEKGTQ